ncbi:uncharacterized protein BDR25DRAFT_316751 [Lindgomyces ingoldianus]|uniref:Uncharacterized protein n=1 Tax=Lindgomyces ingoldianus TaxID=673940 RepID=A0ACB6QK73_9PLEO|nr:uncharacterized protein BDR25DRAFT_316751 [Lindgomyces ingoldianus]KAF2467398.1 hypothetical protein BDR25DRAFT_316751 [Lindgomyces ingoldianus]
MYNYTKEGRGMVRLKVALVGKSFDDQAKFFVKLATVYLALAGDSRGCVLFYRFCKVFVDETGRIINLNAIKVLLTTTKETFALVFNFAEQGDILGFLERRLRPGELEKNYLMTIHKKGIVHCKIFPLLCNKDGNAHYLAGLIRVLERCLDPNPAGRFDATSLVVVMDKIMDGPSGIAASTYGEETE